MRYKLSTPLAVTAIFLSLLVSSLPVVAQENVQVIGLDAKIHGDQTPVPLYLKAGRYQVRPVGKDKGGTYSAWSVWKHSNCQNTQGCERTVPTRYAGLHNNYYVASPHLSDVHVAGKKLPTVSEIPAARNYSYFLKNEEVSAYEVAENKVYPDEKSALNAAQASTFTLDADGRVYFSLLDKSRQDDNRGGMTLEVRQQPQY